MNNTFGLEIVQYLKILYKFNIVKNIFVNKLFLEGMIKFEKKMGYYFSKM